MLKITKGMASDNNSILYLEGKIIGPWLEELRGCCDEVLSTSQRLTLDMQNVSFVDRDAITLFRELTDREVAVTNCSPFVAEQLRELRPGFRNEPTARTGHQ